MVVTYNTSLVGTFLKVLVEKKNMGKRKTLSCGEMLDDNTVKPILIDHLIFQQNAIFIIQNEV